MRPQGLESNYRACALALLHRGADGLHAHTTRATGRWICGPRRSSDKACVWPDTSRRPCRSEKSIAGFCPFLPGSTALELAQLRNSGNSFGNKGWFVIFNFRKKSHGNLTILGRKSGFLVRKYAPSRRERKYIGRKYIGRGRDGTEIA